jgi:hypothetical protein
MNKLALTLAALGLLAAPALAGETYNGTGSQVRQLLACHPAQHV